MSHSAAKPTPSPSRRDVLRGSAALAMAAAGEPFAGPPEERPNVLLIMADQHRYDLSGFAGEGHATTPHLDALAGESTRITDAYAQVPLCVPSRQCLLTGQYASSHGGFRNRMSKVDGQRTFAHDFTGAGYQTAWIGKTHCNTTGFSQTISQGDMQAAHAAANEGARLPDEGPDRQREPRKIIRPLNANYEGPGEGSVFHMEEHVVRETSALLEGRPKDKPFFYVASFLNPHPPLFPPVDFLELYRDADVPWNKNFHDVGPQPFTDLIRRRATQGWKLLPLTEVLNITRAYYACVAWMDHCVGQLLANLKTSGAAKDTIVIYMSDHGEMLGEHGLMQKRALYDSATRTPLMLRWPGKLEAGRTLPRVVEHLDLMRTIYELCGVDCKLDTPGRSFAPMLRGEEQAWLDQARMELTNSSGVPTAEELQSLGDLPAGGFWALRLNQWKFIEHTPEQRGLFNVHEDPKEYTNRIFEPELQDMVEHMRAQLIASNPPAWAFQSDMDRRTGRGR
ncbi:MAG: arylsulfatase A-like enzyme [Planctomycetota bacterium]|jgi:arylsulfatase A-like enzyme